MKTIRSIVLPTLMLAVSAKGAGVCLAATEDSPVASATLVNLLDDSMREHAALTRMRQHVPEARMGTVTLEQALQTFADGTGLRVAVDWEALAAAGLDPQRAVNVRGRLLFYDQYLAAVCAQSGVTMVLYFRGAGGTFSLTTSAACPANVRAKVAAKMPAAPAPKIQIEAPESPADQVARRKLERVGRFQAVQEGFEKTIATLRKDSSCDINVNWMALEAAGIDRNTPVTINLQHAPVKKILELILSNVGGGAANLGYTVSDGVVIISTRDDLNSAKYQVVRIFNIHPFLAHQVSGARTYDDKVKDIVDTIKTTVAPESWRDAGGTIGTIRELNGQLIVNQTVDNERAVGRLLEKLAKAHLAG